MSFAKFFFLTVKKIIDSEDLRNTHSKINQNKAAIVI